MVLFEPLLNIQRFYASSNVSSWHVISFIIAFNLSTQLKFSSSVPYSIVLVVASSMRTRWSTPITHSLNIFHLAQKNNIFLIITKES